MLAVGLGDVEAFDIGGVPLDVITEKCRVVIEVPIVKGEAHLRIDALKRSATFLKYRDFKHGLRRDSGRKTGEWFWVGTFGHTVMHK